MTTDDQPAPVIEPPVSPLLRVIEPADELAARRQPTRLRELWTADRLMAETFPEPRWAVPGLIAEGVSLLAGPPKVGKSWLSLGLGLDIAAGSKALDTIDVNPGDVLYLALEDTPRRLQSRMGKLLAGRPAPSRLALVTTCPPLPMGGDTAIAAWLDEHPDARMVVIDVFAKMRGQSAPGMSAYDADYAAVGRAKKLADHYSVAVVLVHHVRKASADDFLAEVSGTNGLAGAADTTMVLKRSSRGQAEAVLHITGRDVDESEYPLAFEPATGSWRLLAGPAEDYTAEESARILKVRQSWLERQAAQRRIPFTKLGGSYRFTAEHLNAIVATFEATPKSPRPPRRAAQRLGVAVTPPTPTTSIQKGRDQS